MQGADDESLAAAAQKAIDRSRRMTSLAEAAAIETERRATLRAVTSATCRLLNLVKTGSKVTDADIQQTIILKLHEQQLPETDQKVAEIAQGIGVWIRWMG